MELKEFLEKFLPDYEAKYKKECEPMPRGIVESAAIHVKFTNKYFHEALQNFADNACYEQCKICAEVYQWDQPYESKENEIYNAILEAEHPNIDEL